MSRQMKLEELEKELITLFYQKKGEQEFLEKGLEAIKEAHKQINRAEVLANHIAGNTGYPMNFYRVTVKELNLGYYEENECIRKIYTYEGDGRKIRIFEQNWFAGYGIRSPKGGWVGLLDE